MEAPPAHPQNVGFSARRQPAAFATSLTCREAIIQSRRAAPHKMEETAVGALAALPDDVVLRAFLRAPVTAHSSLYAVCHRLKDLLQSDDFRKLRVESGLAEYATIVAESEHDACVTSSWIFSHGRWRRIPTMAHARFTACSVIVDKEMWVIGGQETDGTVLATVEAYSFQTNSWRFCQALSQPRFGAVAGVDDDGRVKFDECIRDIEAQFPPSHTVYEYYVDAKTNEFKLWADKVRQVNFCNFFQFCIVLLIS